MFKQQSNVSRSKPGCVFQNYYISQDKSLSKCRENMFEVTSVGHLACTYYWAIICHPKSLSLLPPFFICITCTNSKTQNVLTEWTTLLVPVLKQTLLFGGVKPLNSMSWWWFPCHFLSSRSAAPKASKVAIRRERLVFKVQIEDAWGCVLFHIHDTQGKTSDSSEDRTVFGILRAQYT